MEKRLFVMLMKDKNKLTKDVVERHVSYLKMLDVEGKLYLCGPFIDYSGGMVIYKVKTKEEAIKLGSNDPFILEGYKTFEIRTLEVASKQNNYGLTKE